MLRKLVSMFAFLLMVPVNCFAFNDREIESQLEWFDRNPKEFMLRDVFTGLPVKTRVIFDLEMLAARNHEIDQIIAATGVHTRATANQHIEDFIDISELKKTNGKILKNLQKIEEMGFQKVDLRTDIWSGGAWLMFRGHTAQRYSLESASSAPSWSSAWTNVVSSGYRYDDVANGRGRVSIDDLSPAEKYDLLISNPNEFPDGLFSRYEWDQGRQEENTHGKVPTWFGYCHGWAAASTTVSRPTSAIDVMAADEVTRVRFYPDDIKALATALWANALPKSTRLLGSRCDQAEPLLDENGRIISPACFEVNPGLFHLAIVNEMGGAEHNLLMDAAHNLEVWNQPIKSYSYRYFNPQTNESGGSFSESKVNVDLFTRDKFRKYRGQEVRQVVGVSMEVEYGRGTVANHELTNTPVTDASKKITYLYDLELDINGDIIGGEWYQLTHPNFIWTFSKRARAAAEGEESLADTWRYRKSVPVAWRGLAAKAAAKGQPLNAIVDALVDWSRGR